MRQSPDGTGDLLPKLPQPFGQDQSTLRTAAYGAVSLTAAATGSPQKTLTAAMKLLDKQAPVEADNVRGTIQLTLEAAQVHPTSPSPPRRR